VALVEDNSSACIILMRKTEEKIHLEDLEVKESVILK
jgi:hypothetical protein